MALSTIADWAGSSIVENLISTAYSYLQDRMMPADSELELKRLQTALPQITAVMSIAEALKMKDPSVGLWVDQFRQAIEASEDVLDELEYKRLEDMVKNRDEVGGSASSSKKRKPCTINDVAFQRLKEAVTMLDWAAKGVECLLQAATILGIRDPFELQQEASKALRRETTSFLAEKEVFGRDVEKVTIISWLKRPTNARLSSFGIVGVGGLGKTTLVQFAYQEMCASNHFDKIIWVCVSTNFSVENITKKMLGELGDSTCSSKPLNALQCILKEKILSKKVLLILDDIWDDNRTSDWEQLIAPLRFVREGSKILLTTRIKSVTDLFARVISTEHESLALKDLHEQDLRLLFNSYAFHGFNLYNHRDLQAIGDQILKMLCGSPLAAKVIGNLLNSCMNHQYWRRILNLGSISNLELAKDVVQVLKLSYYHLPEDLKVCFRFCSIFPHNHLFDKIDLIKMWIASGFIRQQLHQEERPEDIGEDYFNHLLRKSFFEYTKSWEGDERYVMHDLMHELAQNFSYGECCRIEPFGYSVTIPSTVRHVSVHESEIEKVFHLENLRSLVIITSLEETDTDMDLFVLPNNLIKKSLRLLKIYVSKHCELTEDISCLVHLRYLSIKPYYVTESFKYLLPASIYNLYHLQVLEFSNDGDYFGTETTQMTNLVSLRYLRLPKERMKTICGIHKLTSLQVLTFVIGQETGYRINELGTLNNLRHLFIKKIENIGDPTEAKSANLLGKNNLISLSLKWTSESNPHNLEQTEQIIDYLQPHPNLMELTVENYKGQKSPRWMEESPLLSLSSLILFNCPVWKNQLFSWHMPYLKILDIYNCVSLDKLPDMPLSLMEFRVHNVGLSSLPNLYQSFGKSSLRVVEIKSCPNLISLDGFLQQGNLDLQDIETLTINDCEILVVIPIDSFGELLSLKHLTIKDCQNLTKLPSLLPVSMTEFCMHNVGVSTLPEYYQSSDSSGNPSASSLNSSLKKVEIINCPKLTALDGFLQQDNTDFQATMKICIIDCQNLVNLPVSAFGRFVSLTDLTIRNCPVLVVVDKQINLLPMALKHLSIENCGELDVPLLESASHLTTLTDLCIDKCATISRIPSSENAFRSLSSLSIMGCDKLVEQSSLIQAQVVNQGSNLASTKLISHLEIDHLSLLLIEPLRSLTSVSYLRVLNCSGMEALPEQWFLQNSNTLNWLSIWNASTLKSLPATMARCTSLENLYIYDADLLEELPELPASLKEKYIEGCDDQWL